MKFIPELFTRAFDAVRHPRTLVSSKIVLYGMGVLVLFFAYQTIQVILKRHQTEEDIQTFEKQVAELQKTQGSLQELNQFLETDFFAEKEARLKLGMQRPGEEVIILKGNDEREEEQRTIDSEIDDSGSLNGSLETTTSTQTSSLVGKKDTKTKSNPAKWWDYFFVKEIK